MKTRKGRRQPMPEKESWRRATVPPGKLAAGGTQVRLRKKHANKARDQCKLSSSPQVTFRSQSNSTHQPKVPHPLGILEQRCHPLSSCLLGLYFPRGHPAPSQPSTHPQPKTTPNIWSPDRTRANLSRYMGAKGRPSPTHQCLPEAKIPHWPQLLETNKCKVS